METMGLLGITTVSESRLSLTISVTLDNLISGQHFPLQDGNKHSPCGENHACPVPAIVLRVRNAKLLYSVCYSEISATPKWLDVHLKIRDLGLFVSSLAQPPIES